VAEAQIDRHSAVVEQDLPDIYSFIAEHAEIASVRIPYVTHGARHLLRLFRRDSRE
jgi:hypothetical protein